jgi:hypothetical protein
VAIERWTDDRLDDLAAALRPLPGQVAQLAVGVDRMTVELGALRDEVREDMRDLREDHRSSRGEFSQLQRQIAQIGWALVGAFSAAMIALIIALV